ncbi:MAG TPA: FkbM family methyltransferase [Kofleriaceae bacterium]
MSLRQTLETRARRLVGAVIGPALQRANISTLPVRRIALLRELAIEVVIDVGANIGQYAAQTRLYGYRGAIASYEPLSTAYAELSTRASADPQWKTHRFGLGDHAGRATLHVAGNSQSSSLLEMLPRHVASAPESQTVGHEEVELVTLKDVLTPARTFVKIDAQGSERAILEGAGDALDRVLGLELELSLVPLYAGETLFAEMTSWLATRGFELRTVTSGLADRTTGALLQVDALFARTGS